jgi:hypothetical protein
MNPMIGKLFGAIRSVEPGEHISAFPLTERDPAFSRWYRSQWLKNNGFPADSAEPSIAEPVVADRAGPAA